MSGDALHMLSYPMGPSSSFHMRFHTARKQIVLATDCIISQRKPLALHQESVWESITNRHKYQKTRAIGPVILVNPHQKGQSTCSSLVSYYVFHLLFHFGEIQNGHHILHGNNLGRHIYIKPTSI